MIQIAHQKIVLNVINRVVGIVCKNCARLLFENMLLKEKVQKKEKNKLEEELKCSNVYPGGLKDFLITIHH